MRRFHTLALLALATFGCEAEGDGTAVGIELYTAAGQEDLLEAVGPADVIEMVVVNLENPHGSQRRRDLDIASGSGELPSLEFGEDFCVFVRGFNTGDDNPVPHFYGASVAFDVARGDEQTVAIQIGRSDCIGLNASSRLNVHPEGADDMQGVRAGAAMVELLDGRVLILGGAAVDPDGNVSRALDTIEIYEPNRGQFIMQPYKLRTPRAFHTATLLEDGSVLVVGGVAGRQDGQDLLASSASIVRVDAAEPVTQIPSPLTGAEARQRHQAARLSDGSVLVTGGVGAAGTPLRSTYRYFPSTTGDPLDGEFTRQGNLWEARAWHTTSPLPRSGELAATIGGLGPEGALDSVEVFTVNPAQPGCVEGQTPSATNGCWVRPMGLRLAEARWGHAAPTVDRGRQVLVVGGFADAERRELAAGLELLDDQLQLRNGAEVGSLATPRGQLAAVALDDGSVLLSGGRRLDSPITATSRLRPRRAETGAVAGFEEAALPEGCETTEPRYDHQAVKLRHGTVLMSGGVTGAAGRLLTSRRAEIYFPRVVDIETLYP